MKKVLSLIVILAMCLSLFACSSSSKYSGNSEREKVIDAVQARAMVYCAVYYANVKLVRTSCSTVENNGDGTYDVYGKISILDDYGDTYVGKFSAVVSVDEMTCTSFKITKDPVKEN